MSENENSGCGAQILSWLGIGLGFYFWGPIGAIVTFVLTCIAGPSHDRKTVKEKRKLGRDMGDNGSQRDFNISLLILSSIVMKADDKLLNSELDYIKRFYVRNFGAERAAKYIKILREILQKDYDIEKVTAQIRFIDYPSRLQLLYYLFGIAEADGTITKEEMKILAHIANGLNISDDDFVSVGTMFYDSFEGNRNKGGNDRHDYQQDNNTGSQDSLQKAYKILEIGSDVTDEEVKKAYRSLAKKHHPDRVSNLGDDVRKSAEEKLQEINNAYEVIKKQRGMS